MDQHQRVRTHDAWRSDQNQRWDWSYPLLQKVMPRRHLRILCNEHQRQKHSSLPLQDRPAHGHPVSAATSKSLSNQRFGCGHDAFLQPVEIYQTIPATQRRTERIRVGRISKCKGVPPVHGGQSKVGRPIRVCAVCILPDVVSSVMVAHWRFLGSCSVDASLEVDHRFPRPIHKREN